MKAAFIELIHRLQNDICLSLEAVDGKAVFQEDLWTREGGGGGKTRVIANGNVFEKGGVNTSIVHGALPEFIRERFGVTQGFFMAAGISLVIHPQSPLVPTVHANYRYFELYEKEGGEVVDAWFGGGADLTPYYLDEEDARAFHVLHKQACDRIHADLYPVFKKQCDAYFYNAHRGESRGIGGIFYDYLRPVDLGRTSTQDRQTAVSLEKAASNRRGASPSAKIQASQPASGTDKSTTTAVNAQGEHTVVPKLTYSQLLDLAKNNGQAFIDAYIPIVEKHASKSFSEEQRYWQELRRGRYVEFNLIHDRGTLFGLRTNGRVESILMSLPPRVRWDYDARPAMGSPEASLLSVLKKPVDWA
ncbi:MAG: oxygen-dependent coproporphyrinogen oxidase [Bacteroidetes bacterium]|nr:oxygen-dependent coproporphyrinogen oxidase [Bacteroidota bacterium]MCH8525184.1 oxygen-dependent coproporphyrinogen oxidase [Balneolales bacterium]